MLIDRHVLCIVYGAFTLFVILVVGGSILQSRYDEKKFKAEVSCLEAKGTWVEEGSHYKCISN